MVWVDASGVAAEMVEREPVRDRTDEGLIDKTVCQCVARPTVTARVFTGGPLPAIPLGIDAVCE
jgi:hypothetical protein